MACPRSGPSGWATAPRRRSRLQRLSQARVHSALHGGEVDREDKRLSGGGSSGVAFEQLVSATNGIANRKAKLRMELSYQCEAHDCGV